MNPAESLTPAELAAQLRYPEGAVGLAVANWANQQNGMAYQKALAELRIGPGSEVLEIGFGNGRMVPDVVAQAHGVRYTGIDTSQTMVGEAKRFNAKLVTSRRVRFLLATAEEMPFDDNVFDRVFSIGVVHFWPKPERAMAEAHRVLQPGGRMFMACLAPKGAPGFARPELGFHLLEAAAWENICGAAGFSDLDVREVVVEREKADGSLVRLHTIRIEGQA